MRSLPMPSHLSSLNVAALEPFFPPGIRMAGAGLQFLNTILIARLLGDSGSAPFFFWSAIILTSAPMASFGLEQLALRDVPREQDKGGNAVQQYMTAVQMISVSLAFLLGIGILIYAGISEGWKAWQFIVPFGLAGMTSVLIFGEALKGLSHPALGVFFGHFVPASLFTISIVVAGAGLTSEGLIQIWMVCFLVATILLRLARKPQLLGRIEKPKKSLLKGLLSEGSSVCVGSIFGALSFLLPLAILKATRPEAEISYVTTAFRISILFTILSVAIHSVFSPAISRAAKKMDTAGLFKAYKKAIVYSLIALGPILVLGILFPHFIMQIFGDSFRDGANSLRFLLIANLIKVLLGPVLHLLVMVGSSHLLPKYGALKLFIALSAGLLLVPIYGGVGMVFAMTAAFLIEELFALKSVVKKLRSVPNA